MSDGGQSGASAAEGCPELRLVRGWSELVRYDGRWNSQEMLRSDWMREETGTGSAQSGDVLMKTHLRQVIQCVFRYLLQIDELSHPIAAEYEDTRKIAGTLC